MIVSLTCEPQFVLARYFDPAKQLLLVTLYLNTRADGHVRVALDDANKLTFDPATKFQQSDYANDHPHTAGGADRVVTARGTTTIVCP